MSAPSLSAMSAHRKFFARLWLLGSVAYGCLRALLVWRFLSGYGVNPWWFAAVELSSSALYGWSSGRVVIDVIDEDWRRLRLNGPMALITYFAPDAYVFATIGELPRDLLATVVAIVVVSAIVTAISLVRSVRRARRHAHE